MLSLKNRVLKSVHALGYDIVRRHAINDRDFAAHLGQLFEALRVDCVLDVGANVGQYRDFLRERVGYTGRIVSFEPVRQNIATLERRAQLDHDWTIEGYALGSQAGTQRMNVMRADVFSSFLEPDTSRVPSMSDANQVDHVEEVPIRSLDEVLGALRERLGLERCYLKLDTQGFDLEVLRGAERTLSTMIAGTQTEASVIGLYKGMPSYIDTIQFLTQRGFEITTFQPVNRDQYLRLIEFDCVMRNTRLDGLPSASRLS